MANGSEQGGEGTYVSLADLMDPLAGSPTHGQRVPTSFVNPPVIGKLQKVTGSVTITRANVIVAQPAVSDLVYEGDLIETGIDGLVSIVFVDGTTFRLYDSAHMVLDEFVFSSERSSNSALFRVLNGRFSFLSGLVAATGRLMIDTAVARIQNTRPAAGIGGLAFTVFTVGLIHELNAASANIALLDDGTISCKDLKHGVFEIITKGDHPQRFIVDDPCVSIHFQIVGSQVRVSEVANSQGQMAAFHDAFLSTLDSFLRGQQDPLIQEWQHANADPHSTTTVGSSTQPGQQLGFAQLAPNSETTLITSAGGGSGGTTSGLTLAAAVNIPLNVIWDSSSSGTWPTSSGWNDGAPPLPIQNVIIDNNDNPTKVTFDTNASILGLTIEAGAILNIVGGSLTVTEATTNSGLIEINSSGVDPTFAITGNISLLGGGEIWLRPPSPPNPAANMIIAVGASTLTNVNNTIFGSGTIGTGDGTLTLINDAAGTIDALGGTLILDTGHTINNSGILAAGLVTAVTTALTGTATGSGTLQIDDAVDNTGNLDAGHNSTLIVDGPVTDTGSATIGANAILEFQSSVSATQTIAYTGSPGTLALSDPTDFHASIIGLIDGDKIDLTDIAPSDIASATIEGSTLVVLETTGAGGAALTFNIAGSLSGSYFSVQSDGGVGSDLILQLTVSTEDEWIKPSYVPALYVDGSGQWNSTAANVWSDGVPTSTSNVLVDLSGAYTITVSGAETANSLTISDSNATVSGSGSLSIATITNSGEIEALGGMLTIYPSTIGNAGTLAADSAQLDLVSLTVTNTGAVEATGADGIIDLQNVLRISGGVVTTMAASDAIEATSGTSTIEDVTSFTNAGLLEAIDGATLVLGGETVTNTGTVEADDATSTIDLQNAIISGGTVETGGNGILDLTGSALLEDGSFDNAGKVNVSGGGNGIENETSITNSGAFEVMPSGALTLSTDGTIDNTTGSFTVDGTGTLTVNDTTIQYGSVSVDGLLDSTGTSSISDAAITITSTGKLEATGGTLTIDPSTISNAGTLEANGAQLDLVSLTVTNTGTVEATGTDGIIDLQNATIDGGTVSTGSGDAIEATVGTSTIENTINFSNAGTLAANGAQLDLGGLTVTNTGTVEATGTEGIIDLQNATIDGGTVNVYGLLDSTGISAIDGATITNTGTIETTAGTLTIDPGSLTNSGLLEASGGALIGGTWTMNGNDPSELIVDSSVNNSGGMIDVQYGSTVDIAGSISGGNAIIDGGTLTYGGSSSVATSFDGIGMLVLDGTNASNHFTGTLSDFGNGDIIDLAGIAYSNAHLTYDDDTLTVSDGLSGPSITIQLAGSYVASNFVLSKDANGDAEVTFTSGEEAYEAPTLWLGGTTATVSVDGTVTLPSITAIPVDSDDKLTVTIDGLPTGATITDNGTVFSGSSITLTEATVGTTFSLDDLTLNDGTTNTASFTLEVTANNTTFGEQGSSATQDITVMVTPDAPAGVAGSAINLALANPSAADGEPVAITVTGVPSGWQLNEGTNLGNGTWTVEPNDLGALTVTTANEFTGAMVLQVTETWTNADGSTGIAIVADNVEAYAPGSPIFALSGADTLTGAGANDVFVFAQPIGNDTIHNFNPASDKIDLVGFTNINGFSDIQADISQDSGGDAVITLASGETITLHGVSAAALSASDFVFNETPVTENSGDMTISDGAVLPLGGTIDNTGTIALNSTGDQTELQIVGAGVMLQGGGEVVLSDSSDNVIVGTNAATTLTNVDNTMSGAGQIGIGDGNLTLVNEAHGIIDANVSGETLTINTGNAMTNTGTLEASNGGTLLIDDAVNNSGAGTALIEGGIVDFASTTNVNEITFNNGSGSPTYGELVLGDPTNGQNVTISGFTGTAPNLTDSDSIDLAGTWTVESETSSGGNTVLSLKDGPATVTLTFDDFNGTLNVASDGNGGMLITDPPATQSCGSPVSIGGPGNDNFIFHPSLGADTGHFDPAADTTEYGQFSSPVEQHWALQIREDTIECAHAGDASTPPDLDATHVHFALHNAFHLQ